MISLSLVLAIIAIILSLIAVGTNVAAALKVRKIMRQAGSQSGWSRKQQQKED